MNTPTFLDRLSSPPRDTDRDRLRAAVEGRTVVITGASYGLGEATARDLGAAGAKVLLAARSTDQLDAVAADITPAGGSAHAYQLDLTDLDGTSAVAARLLDEHGAPDVVINNAGMSIRRSLELQYNRPQDFERTMAVNYLGPVRLLLGLLPAMRDAGQGHLVNVSTIGVRIPPGPRWGAYQASKGAFDTWARSVEPELKTAGIDMTSIYMALIRTRMSAPTPIMRRLPGLDADQAADVVARALTRRPRRIAPWWVTPTELSGVAAERLVNVVYSQSFRWSADSERALGHEVQQ
ncbi:Short-chain dehydrogenase [Gordonia malaquae]|uniref:Putative oxidoreductase n=1 Tax=Gordonia malaquae NBRC 108250 TaxID=1223542 RepID=M3V0F3_GORML|nr:SDR family NAD(P)-dependent oxidoreductase [Gordonia malaquae]GAC81942.1 putative oxidoreductase [Gordonia malaquae NBRC 108250]SEE19497.1 Short-chain dehydrogenase [Gordonia malaquae]